jgi:Zn-dependent M28 family amino/carboxypeptidase
LGAVKLITYSENVIAETVGGNKDSVLVIGGHSDSVQAGPGINDDGSGIIGILEVAEQLTGYAVNNSVRVAFWAAEEFGLLGSYHYTENLSAEEAAKIRLYLNFDMIASPNYILGIYDGDGSAYNQTGPAGSGQAEAFFEDFFAANGLNSVPTDFSGRSDYAGFLNLGIASGGLFTGAEVVKTEEQAALFGGEAGVSYDVNYHRAGDNITNLAWDAFEWNTKAIAASVAEYATSFESLGPVNATTVVNRRRNAVPAHKHNHEGGCGKESL